MAIVSLFVSFALLLPALWFALECFAGLKRRGIRPTIDHRHGDDISAFILVPAHNEEASIGNTLLSLKRAIGTRDDILVIADHCTDRTEAIVREVGIAVLDRTGADRGKGFALRDGLQFSRYDHDVVVVIDADCEISAESLSELKLECRAQNNPVQGNYILNFPGSGSGGIRSLAWRIKNQIRPLGAYRLHSPCLLNGTGMAFPRALAITMHWGDAHLAEDILATVSLARDGRFTAFVPDATISSDAPTTESAAETQKSRWIGGHLEVLFKDVPRLFIMSLARADIRGLLLCLEISVLPLSLFVVIALINAVVASVLVIAFGRSGGVTLAGFLPLLVLTITILVVALKSPDESSIPVVKTLVTYLGATLAASIGHLLRRRKMTWVRTARTPAPADMDENP